MTKQEKYEARLKSVAVSAIPVGGHVHFDSLTGAEARKLIESGAADPESRQNSSPTFEEITRFLEKDPQFHGHGYIIVPTREDERIELEGVVTPELKPLTLEQVLAFTRMFSSADEFEVKENYARAWYD